jgi:hypothetical protein
MTASIMVVFYLIFCVLFLLSLYFNWRSWYTISFMLLMIGSWVEGKFLFYTERIERLNDRIKKLEIQK